MKTYFRLYEGRRFFPCTAIVGVLFSSVLAAAASTVLVQSTFDSDLEGWTAGLGDISWASSGGNPGGYIGFTDVTDGTERIFAPTAFLGDWSLLDGIGTVEYDQRLFAEGPDPNFKPYTIRISGPGGVATWQGATPSGTTGWVNVIAEVEESSWSVSAGSWSGLLADVTELRIDMEIVMNSDEGEIGGIDNVTLAVPEPSMALLALIGVAGVAVQRRRRV